MTTKAVRFRSCGGGLHVADVEGFYLRTEPRLGPESVAIADRELGIRAQVLLAPTGVVVFETWTTDRAQATAALGEWLAPRLGARSWRVA